MARRVNKTANIVAGINSRKGGANRLRETVIRYESLPAPLAIAVRFTAIASTSENLKIDGVSESNSLLRIIIINLAPLVIAAILERVFDCLLGSGY
jgi:hypothetical protein